MLFLGTRGCGRRFNLLYSLEGLPNGYGTSIKLKRDSNFQQANIFRTDSINASGTCESFSKNELSIKKNPLRYHNYMLHHI